MPCYGHYFALEFPQFAAIWNYDPWLLNEENSELCNICFKIHHLFASFEVCTAKTLVCVFDNAIEIVFFKVIFIFLMILTYHIKTI